MRNYVIINGVNSLSIKGLVINELPSITKPTMRSLREEIDGRDGDIITELGYSAYDKEMSIGLYPSYNIDEIIAFFNGSGTIVFSNEKDKYYNFKILNNIDYEKLLKFKTAIVTFHCQPFKYPLEEVPLKISASAIENGSNEILIVNKGNTYSKPTIDLVGEGDINVYLDNSQIFRVNVENEVVIDGDNLEAYDPNTHQLKNRNVIGNITNLKLPPGNSKLSFDGNLTEATIIKYTRWL